MKDLKKTIAVIAVSVALSQGLNVLGNNNAATLNSLQPAAALDTLDKVIQNGVMRCAYIPYPPFFEIDPNTGAKSGVMVDVMEAVTAKMGVKLEWSEEVGWGSMMEGLKMGRYDAVCSNVWQNTARAMQADFSNPIGYASVETWVRSDDETIRSLDDINSSVTIATIDGEMNAMIAASQFPNSKTLALPQTAPYSDALLNVVQGKADVIFAEKSAVDDFLVTHPGALKSLGTDNTVSSFPITLVLPKREIAFKSVIDTAIEEMIHSRELDRIMAQYGEGIFNKPLRTF